jgi:hypothetical protein
MAWRLVSRSLSWWSDSTASAVYLRSVTSTAVQKSMRGLVERPTTWNELKDRIKENSLESLGKLGRLPDDIRTYRAFRQKVGIAVYDFPVQICTK